MIGSLSVRAEKSTVGAGVKSTLILLTKIEVILEPVPFAVPVTRNLPSEVGSACAVSVGRVVSIITLRDVSEELPDLSVAETLTSDVPSLLKRMEAENLV